jgi:hypothetical protein
MNQPWQHVLRKHEVMSLVLSARLRLLRYLILGSLFLFLTFPLNSSS